METTKSFQGHEIVLQSDWTFKVSGPEFDSRKYGITFNSFNDAKEEIEKRIAESAKIAAKNVSFVLSALDAIGEAVDISKINRNTAEIIGLETETFYPNIEWLREALIRKTRLESEFRVINQTLKPFEMRRTVGYGRMDAENYLQRIERLKREFNEKREAAAQYKKISLTDKPEVA